MKTFDVLPGEGVGPVRLGMHRDEVRRAMPEAPKSFWKWGAESGGYETDAYHRSGFQVYYKGDVPRVEFIELSRECGFDAIYRGRDVFDTEAEDLVEFIAQDAPFDDRHQELGYSFIFPRLELSLWRPVLPEVDPKGRFFSTIGVGVEGYFSRGRHG
jgi:hypothetical protein